MLRIPPQENELRESGDTDQGKRNQKSVFNDVPRPARWFPSGGIFEISGSKNRDMRRWVLPTAHTLARSKPDHVAGHNAVRSYVARVM